MAIAFDASSPPVKTGTGTNTAMGATASFTPPAGSLIVAFTVGENGSSIHGPPVGTISDSIASTWTLKQRQTYANEAGAEVWICDAPTATARTVSSSFTGSNVGAFLYVAVLTGAAPVSAQTGATAAASSTAYGVSITTTIVGSVPVMTYGNGRTNVVLTVTGSNTLLASFNDTTRGATSGACNYTETVTPGATTIGFSNTAVATGEKAAVEILPLGASTWMGNPFGSLADPFNATSLNTAAWTQTLGGTTTMTYADTGASIVFPTPADTTNRGQLTSNAIYDFTGSSLTLHVVTVPNPAGNADGMVGVYVDSDNCIQWAYENGTLYAQTMVATVKTTIASFAYSSTTHAYWRISESAGVATWWTSSDGVAWTSQGTQTHGLTVTAMGVFISMTCWQSETSAGVFEFNRFNSSNQSLSIATY